MLVLFIFIAVIVGVVFIYRAISEQEESKGREEKHRQEVADGVRKLKNASDKWDYNRKMDFLYDLNREYSELQRKKQELGWLPSTVLMVEMNGKIEYISIDSQGITEVYNYINNSLNNHTY